MLKAEANAARNLVEMILYVGVLHACQVTPENLRWAHEFYRHHSKATPENQESHDFRMRFRCSIPPIQFVGCFDIDESHRLPQLPCPFDRSLRKSLHYYYRLPLTEDVFPYPTATKQLSISRFSIGNVNVFSLYW